MTERNPEDELANEHGGLSELLEEWAGQTMWVGRSAVEWLAQQEMSQVKRLVELRIERQQRGREELR